MGKEPEPLLFPLLLFKAGDRAKGKLHVSYKELQHTENSVGSKLSEGCAGAFLQARGDYLPLLPNKCYGLTEWQDVQKNHVIALKMICYKNETLIPSPGGESAWYVGIC